MMEQQDLAQLFKRMREACPTRCKLTLYPLFNTELIVFDWNFKIEEIPHGYTVAWNKDQTLDEFMEAAKQNLTNYVNAIKTENELQSHD